MDNTKDQGISVAKSMNFEKPTYEDWKLAAEKLLKGKPFDKILLTNTYEGLQLQPIYHQWDVDNIEDTLPGVAPYKRGTNAAGYHKKSWETAQEAGAPTPQLINEILSHDLEKGLNAINIRFDNLSSKGLNPAESEDLFANGVSVSTLEDMKIIFNNVDITKYPIRIKAGLAAPTALAMLKEVAGDKAAEVSGCIMTDPAGFAVENGYLPASWECMFDQMAQMIKWAKENMPQMRVISIDSTPYHNGGGSAVEELTYVMNTALLYMDEMEKRGLDVETVSAAMEVSFSLGAQFFMEVAKIRTARIIWSTLIDAMGGSAEAQKLFVHAKTSEWNKTVYDPYVNMLRVTTEAFSGVVSSVDSLQVSEFDATIRSAQTFSRRIARNVHIVLKEESHLDHVIDPAGGSYLVEHLTEQLSELVLAKIAEIEEMGGIVKALENEVPQKKVAEVMAAKQKNLAHRKDVFVGTNMYPNLTEELLSTDTDEDLKKERIDAVKLSGKEITIDNANLIESAAKAYADGATLEEVSKAMWAGEEVKIAGIAKVRATEAFEQLRIKISEKEEAPMVYLANFGPLRQHKARADFSRGFFEVAGFNVVYGKECCCSGNVALHAINSGAKVMVLCSTDDTYPELAPDFIKEVKANVEGVQFVLAGYPKDQIEMLKEAGVDEFIHMRANALQILSDIAKKGGIQ